MMGFILALEAWLGIYHVSGNKFEDINNRKEALKQGKDIYYDHNGMSRACNSGGMVGRWMDKEGNVWIYDYDNHQKLYLIEENPKDKAKHQAQRCAENSTRDYREVSIKYERKTYIKEIPYYDGLTWLYEQHRMSMDDTLEYAITKNFLLFDKKLHLFCGYDSSDWHFYENCEGYNERVEKNLERINSIKSGNYNKNIFVDKETCLEYIKLYNPITEKMSEEDFLKWKENSRNKYYEIIARINKKDFY